MDFKKPRPKISFRGLRKFLIVFFSLVAVFIFGYLIGSKGYGLSFRPGFQLKISRENPVNRQAVDFSLFWLVWDTIDQNYFDKTKINQTDMVYGAITGLVSALGDPYTAFLPPSENKVVEEDLSGSFEGVGIQIGFRGTQLAVIAPLPGTPAEKAGVKAGDYIIAIKDEEKDIETATAGISVQDAVKIIRGKSGTSVSLTLLREGVDEPIVVDLVRAKVDVPSIILSYTGENEEIARIQLLKFVDETDEEWNKAVTEILKKDSVNKIILDLRNNPGGYMEQAIDIAGEFVERGSVIVIEERGDKKTKEYSTQRIGLLTKTPLIVLVNQGSASASEILAGALRDIKGVTIVGETTFGKGTIQEPLQLEGGAGLHITVAKWLTPKGSWVNEKGLKPDIEVIDNLETEVDEQLQKAIESF